MTYETNFRKTHERREKIFNDRSFEKKPGMMSKHFLMGT